MKKKIISILSAAAIMLGSFTPVLADTESNILSLLNGLKIMQGDGNGNYRLDDSVSRAEFTKVVVAASSAKDMVAAGLKISPFSDVKYTDWFAPYVQAAVTNGLCEGYMDGTFKPNDTVSYEEAITMLLRALGYSEDDFGVSWPFGQVGMAQNLEMTDDVNSAIGQDLTRRQVARLVYNTLNTKQKTSGSKLIDIFDCKVSEGVTIIASHNQDSSLNTDKINTTIGILEIDDNFDFNWVGKKGDIIVKNDDDVVSFMPDDGEVSTAGLDRYVIYSLLPNVVVGYKDGAFRQIDIKDSTTCYKGTLQTTYASVKGDMEMGDILYVKMDGSAVDYVSYAKGVIEGPVKVLSSEWINQFETDANTQIMRDGNKTTASGILTNDIVYFSKELNMVLAYTDKITGIYESAYPTKDAPTSVKISGKEYTVESVEAFNALSSSGTIKIGDTITILLGKTGEIAGVVNANDNASTTAVGYVTGSGSKTYTNDLGQEYSSYYVTMVGTDGVTSEYQLSTDGSRYVGYVCKFTFQDNQVKIQKTNSTAGVFGRVSKNNLKLGDSKVSENIRIIDTIVSNVLYTSTTYKRIYLQRLDGMTINASNVLYYEKNSAGEITDLILKNVTGDAYKFGIVTNKVSTNSEATTPESYVIEIDGIKYNYSSGIKGIAKGTPIMAIMEDSEIKSFEQLKLFPSKVSKLTHTEAVVNNMSYTLSDSVLVYKIDKSFNVTRMTLDDAINGNYNLSAYSDKSASEGGRVRVIVAK